MEIIYFVYGLAFFSLGLAIVVATDAQSRLSFAKVLRWLGAFAFVHALVEWTMLWQWVTDSNLSPGLVLSLLLFVSFIFLFEFGRELLLAALPLAARQQGWARLLNRWIYAPMLGVVALGVATSADPVLALAIWSRYLPGGLGSWLAGASCFYYARQRLNVDPDASEPTHSRLPWYLAAAAFAAYGVLGGLVVPRANWFPASVLNEENFQASFGLPVQLLRAACAVVIAIAASRQLHVFAREDGFKRDHAKAAQQFALDQYLDTEARLQAVLDTMSEGVLGVAPDGTLSFANRLALTGLGFRADELVGQPFLQLIHHTPLGDAPVDPRDCPIRKTLADGEVRHVPKDLFWRKYGSCMPVSYRCGPVLRGQKIVGVTVTFRDLSEQA